MLKTPALVILPLIAIAIILAVTFFIASDTQRKGQIMNNQTQAPSRLALKDITITVTYDNNPYKKGLKTAWGFSCLIAGSEKTILFDTGGDGSLLLANMQKLQIAPNAIDIIVLSHIHGDHTGGLDSFLEKNSNVTVYLPQSFPKRFKANVQTYGAKIVQVEQALEICEDVYSTGQLGKMIKEQSLIIRTESGLIIITGCAHPGISKIIKTAKEFLNDDILLVMGGFHLEWAGNSKIEKIISAFKELNVRYVGPCHCSGSKARDLFEKYFGKNYVNVGVGKMINLADLRKG